MKKQCDKVLTIDNFSEEYSSWKGRSLTVMDDQIKVSQAGLKPRYYDTIYLFEENGIMVGFSYVDVVPECYITTMDGLESEPYADVAPYIFIDMGRTYAVVKKYYRNTDLKKHVIGLNLLAIPSLDALYEKFTWPMWESIESLFDGILVIKKHEKNYAISTIGTFPSCRIIMGAVKIERDVMQGNIYHVLKKETDLEEEIIDLNKVILKNKKEIYG